MLIKGLFAPNEARHLVFDLMQLRMQAHIMRERCFPSVLQILDNRFSALLAEAIRDQGRFNVSCFFASAQEACSVLIDGLVFWLLWDGSHALAHLHYISLRYIT